MQQEQFVKMANTGYKIFLNRQSYVGGIWTGVTEANTEFLPNGDPDPNYVPPELDLTMCPTSVTVYSRTLSATNSGIPCNSGTGFVTRYIDNNGTPQVGDYWYIDNPGTTKLNGGGNWFYYNGSGSTQHRIGSDGRIDAITTAC